MPLVSVVVYLARFAVVICTFCGEVTSVPVEGMRSSICSVPVGVVIWSEGTCATATAIAQVTPSSPARRADDFEKSFMGQVIRCSGDQWQAIRRRRQFGTAAS